MPRAYSPSTVCAAVACSLIGVIAGRGDTFHGTGPAQFDIDFALIGNAGNLDDAPAAPGEPTFGGVPYEFRMSRYEISRAMVEIYNGVVGNPVISFNGGFGSPGDNLPALGVNWNEAARFVNWLNTSQGYQPAYQFAGPGASSNITLWDSADAWQQGGENRFRHKDAFYFLPNDDEWYKAAYYDGSGGVYYDYATGSDTVPTAVAGGTAAGTAVYGQDVAAGPAAVNNAGGLSPYGTMGQNGNVLEWVENNYFGGGFDDPTNLRTMRGGFYYGAANLLPVLSPQDPAVFSDFVNMGFRVAAVVPEPSTWLFGMLGACGLLARRRR